MALGDRLGHAGTVRGRAARAWYERDSRMQLAETTSRRGILHPAAARRHFGYFDQAHFMRDFKSVVGRSPADYAAA